MFQTQHSYWAPQLLNLMLRQLTTLYGHQYICSNSLCGSKYSLWIIVRGFFPMSADVTISSLKINIKSYHNTNTPNVKSACDAHLVIVTSKYTSVSQVFNSKEIHYKFFALGYPKILNRGKLRCVFIECFQQFDSGSFVMAKNYCFWFEETFNRQNLVFLVMFNEIKTNELHKWNFQ